MAKNDWRSSPADTGTRTNMNQPYWIASGVYNPGSSRIELTISPGSIRYPGLGNVVYSGQPQQLLLNNPQSGTYYTIFARSTLGTFIVSGTTSATVPFSPRYDAEYIGRIFTGASLSTANLAGPWNQGAFGGYEQRGQMGAVSARTRCIFSTGNAANLASLGLMNLDTSATTSGIAFLTFADTALRTDTKFDGVVVWCASGLAGQQAGIQFDIINSDSQASIFRVIDVMYLPVAVNPDPGPQNKLTKVTPIVAVNNVQASNSGYRLMFTPLNTNTAGITARLLNYTFSAVVGQYTSDTNEAP